MLHILENHVRAQRQREQRSMRGDNQVIIQTALETQSRHPESAILIELVSIKAVISRFRNPPWGVFLTPIINLAVDYNLESIR